MAWLEARVGKIPLAGRYHKAPSTIGDDYVLSNQALGSGGTSWVWMATSRNNTQGHADQKFAVKAFTLSTDVEKRARVKMEAEIFLCMDHPHITRLYDVYESEDELHLVMEHLEGGELFDRIAKKKKFCERDAAGAIWQMLLSVNYIHAHDIVHRDLKLENFVYERDGSDHLKLIDFGLSKIWDPDIKMHLSCGTISYIAPEVLRQSYTSQCDLWSLGVIAFILLSGSMPFVGSRDQQVNGILAGAYRMRPQLWNTVSPRGRDFTRALLQVDPCQRLTAEQALRHSWLTQAQQNVQVDCKVVEALRQFGQASKFRRCCMQMMALSLSKQDRAAVRQQFVAMDRDHRGTITLRDLRQVLEEGFHLPEDETRRVFDALDSNHDEEIHYSDFLAAMVSTRIALHEDLLSAAFRKFDVDRSGFITPQNLQEVLGDTCRREEVAKFVAEADQDQDGRISYGELVSYLRQGACEAADAAVAIIDAQLEAQPEIWTSTSGLPRLQSKQITSKSLVTLAASSRGLQEVAWRLPCLHGLLQWCDGGGGRRAARPAAPTAR